jgi:hypothetical protein
LAKKADLRTAFGLRVLMLPKLGFSNRKKLPVWKLGNRTFPLWDYWQIKRKIQPYSLKVRADGLWEMHVFGYDMVLTDYYGMLVLNESNLWDRYLATDIKDKVVLDVGAGCGETALWFLSKGAKHVVAIESDDKAFELLVQNTKGHSVDCISGKFNLDSLNIPHDYLKLDIEGGEDIMLQASDLRYDKPFVVEIHDKSKALQWQEKFNLVLLYDPQDSYLLMGRS